MPQPISRPDRVAPPAAAHPVRIWPAAVGVVVALAAAAALLQSQHWLRVVLGFLEPWEPSAVVLIALAVALWLYGVGWARSVRSGVAIGVGRHVAFAIGMLLTYLALQSRVDYYAQHMFWIHRLQHLVLHHLAPLLLVLAAPGALFVRGLPARLQGGVARVASNPILNGIYRVLQQPVIAALLFVGLIYFWLFPTLHYDAMLSAPLYNTMNWSMFVDGLLFWMVMLDGQPKYRVRPSYGVRVVILWLIMIPQILLGAYITLHRSDLYDVYAVCGRAWNTDPLLDQRIGGLITWIPASMMSVIAAIIVLRMWRHDRRVSANGRA